MTRLLLLRKIAVLKILLASLLALSSHATASVPMLGGSGANPNPGDTIVVQVASTTATTTETYNFYDKCLSVTSTLYLHTSDAATYASISSHGAPANAIICPLWKDSFEGYGEYWLPIQ